MKKIITLIVVIFIIAAGIFILTKNSSTVNAPAQDRELDTTTSNASLIETGEVKEFTMTATNFKYSLEEIKVNQGDTVIINLVVEEGFHDWKIDEFKAATAQYKAGGKETIQFVANQAGTFEYYCSVGEHRALGMVGNLIVE